MQYTTSFQYLLFFFSFIAMGDKTRLPNDLDIGKSLKSILLHIFVAPD